MKIISIEKCGCCKGDGRESCEWSTNNPCIWCNGKGKNYYIRIRGYLICEFEISHVVLIPILTILLYIYYD